MCVCVCVYLCVCVCIMHEACYVYSIRSTKYYFPFG